MLAAYPAVVLGIAAGTNSLMCTHSDQLRRVLIVERVRHFIELVGNLSYKPRLL